MGTMSSGMHSVDLNHRRWLVLVGAAAWTALCTWLVTGIHFGGSWYDFLSRIGEPLNAALLSLVPASIGIVFAGRWMSLQNWKQWALLSMLAVFQVVLWVGVLNHSGRHVAERFNEFLDQRSYPARLSPDSAVSFAFALVISTGLGGFLIGLLSPPGLRQRARSLLSTPGRRQLATLLAAATWVSGATLSYHCPSLGAEVGCELRELARVVGTALPAVLFGGIFFWWFGRVPR